MTHVGCLHESFGEDGLVKWREEENGGQMTVGKVESLFLKSKVYHIRVIKIKKNIYRRLMVNVLYFFPVLGVGSFVSPAM